VGAKDVGGDCGCKVGPELLLVCTDFVGQDSLIFIKGINALVLHVNHPLRMGIPKVTFMGRAYMNLGFIERVCDLVGENAGGQTRDDFLCLLLVGCF